MCKRQIVISTIVGAAAIGVSGAGADVVDIESGGFKFSISGQINQGILYADDGVDSNSFVVDNDNSSTRARAKASFDFGSFVIGGEIEYEFEFSSTATINQLNTDSSVSVSNERKFELFTQGKFGKFSFGQGDSASNGASEVDLSGTTVVGYSGISDLAGGILFRDGTDALTTSNVGGFFSNLDGNSRINRIRYDTPEIGGFIVSASAGNESRNDLAVRYGGQFNNIKFESAIAYSENASRDRLHGSISGLHEPSGFSMTFAAGADDLDGQARDPNFAYIKAGYQTSDLLPFGLTAFSIDYYDGNDIGVAGDNSESIGIQAVQKIDRYNTEVYLGYRNYSYASTTESLQDVDAVLFGVRYKF